MGWWEDDGHLLAARVRIQEYNQVFRAPQPQWNVLVVAVLVVFTHSLVNSPPPCSLSLPHSLPPTHTQSITEYNGASMCAMTGKNCVAIAADTRLGIQVRCSPAQSPSYSSLVARISHLFVVAMCWNGQHPSLWQMCSRVSRLRGNT